MDTDDAEEAGYSTNPSTIGSRRHYAKLTKPEKRQLFKKQAKHKESRWKLGYCKVCSRKREPHRIALRLCQVCADRQTDKIKNYSINNALEDKCCKCPNKAKGNHSHCESCLKKAREYRAAKRKSTNGRPSQER